VQGTFQADICMSGLSIIKKRKTDGKQGQHEASFDQKGCSSSEEHLLFALERRIVRLEQVIMENARLAEEYLF